MMPTPSERCAEPIEDLLKTVLDFVARFSDDGLVDGLDDAITDEVSIRRVFVK